MFDGLDDSIRTSVYALAALHLPTHSSQKWNQNFLKALLVELKLPDTQYQAFYPLTNKVSSTDEIFADVSIERLSFPFLAIIDNAGLVRADLFIALSIYMRFSGYFDARGRVLLRNLVALTPISEELRIAVDLIIQEKLHLAVKRLVEDQGVYNASKAPKSQAMRYLKIGSAAVLTGAVLAVTGGLAAPAIAVALTAMGGAAVAATISTTAIAVLFGTAGAGLASYKMDKRTTGIKEFEIERYPNNQQVGSGSTVMLMVSGYMGSGEDYKRAFGVMPTHIGLKERLVRYYQRFDKARVNCAEREAIMYAKKPLRDWYFTKLRRIHGHDPWDLNFAQDEKKILQQNAARLKEEERLTGSLFNRHKDHSRPENTAIPTDDAARVAGTKTAADAKTDGESESDYVAQLVRYRGVIGQYVATGLSESVRKAKEKGTEGDIASPERGDVTGACSGHLDADTDTDTDLNERKNIARAMIEDSNMTQSTSDVSDSMINKTDGNESGNRSAPLKTKNQQELHATKGAVNSHDGTAITTANTSICSRSSNGKASESSSSVAIKPAAAASPIPPPPPPPIPASSSSSWSSSLSSLSPLAYLPTIPTPGFFKSGTQSQEEKGSAKGKEIVEGATDQQICQSKNEGLVSLFEEFWNWPEYSQGAAFDLHLLRWETALQLNIGKSIVSAWVELGKTAAQDAVIKTFFSALSLAALLPTLALTLTNMIYSLWSLAILRADQAGIELAHALSIRPPGSPPVTLVGFSLGGRVVFSCLKALADMQYGHLAAPKLVKKGTEGTALESESSRGPGWFPSTASDEEDTVKDDADHEDESGFSVKAAVEGECTNGSDGKKSCKDLNKCTERDLRGIVMDAVIVGAPLCSTSRHWARARKMTAGRLINGYSRRDLVLAISYRFQTMKGRIAGLTPISEEICPGVENSDLSNLIASHLDYCTNMKAILEILDLTSPKGQDSSHVPEKISSRVEAGIISLRESIGVANVLYSVV